MDEPIEVPFGMRTRIGLRNHVLAGGGGADPPREGALLGSYLGMPGLASSRYSQSYSLEGSSNADYGY